ncbi:MAG: hypothetical protein PVI65_13740, partial [Desulfobacterales bacterium]
MTSNSTRFLLFNQNSSFISGTCFNRKNRRLYRQDESRLKNTQKPEKLASGLSSYLYRFIIPIDQT